MTSHKFGNFWTPSVTLNCRFYLGLHDKSGNPPPCTCVTSLLTALLYHIFLHSSRFKVYEDPECRKTAPLNMQLFCQIYILLFWSSLPLFTALGRSQMTSHTHWVDPLLVQHLFCLAFFFKFSFQFFWFKFLCKKNSDFRVVCWQCICFYLYRFSLGRFKFVTR